MRLADANLQLSSSDLSGFLACEHLTTFDLAVVRGEFERPGVENDQRDLIQRKGEEHERGYLAWRRSGLAFTHASRVSRRYLNFPLLLHTISAFELY